MKRLVVSALSFVVFLASILMGIFAAMGFCATIFGPEILETILGDTPDRTHPAFLAFMVLMVPGMIIGASGALFGIIIPLNLWLGYPVDRNRESTRAWLHHYAIKLASSTAPKPRNGA